MSVEIAASDRIDLPRALQDTLERAAKKLISDHVGEDQPYIVNANVMSDNEGPYISLDLAVEVPDDPSEEEE